MAAAWIGMPPAFAPADGDGNSVAGPNSVVAPNDAERVGEWTLISGTGAQDGNMANNCRFNLRVCTPQENRRNVPGQRRGCSRFKGVHYDKQRDRISPQIKVQGKIHWLGRFATEVEAA